MTLDVALRPYRFADGRLVAAYRDGESVLAHAGTMAEVLAWLECLLPSHAPGNRNASRANRQARAARDAAEVAAARGAR